MKGEPLEYILTNARPGIRYAVIHHYKGQFNLTVKLKSVPAKMLHQKYGPYTNAGRAKAAYCMMFQPAKYWAQPKWKELKK